jgi:hypothetical protein
MYRPKTNEAVGTTDYVAPEGEEDLDPAARLRRRLESAEATLNSPECSTVVTNDAGFLVGQLVGDCVFVDISNGEEGAEFANPAELCISTKDEIVVADYFPNAGVAVKTVDEEGEDVYKVYSEATVKLTQHCVDVQSSIALCPIFYGADYETATADLGSNQCAFVEEIVQEIALTQKCSAGDRKSCEWLEYGSTSFYVAAAGLSAAVIAVIAVIGACCCGAWAHPKRRQVML